jgi:hypothetical protein
MPRHARLDRPGTVHVMVRGIEQRQIVDDEAERADFVRRVEAFGCRNRGLEPGFNLYLRRKASSISVNAFVLKELINQ